MKPIELKVETEQEFWKYYISVLQTAMPKKNRLTDKETRLMAYILASDIDKDYFKRPYRDGVVKALTVSNHNLHMLGGKLRTKGWLVDKLPAKKLRELQQHIKTEINSSASYVGFNFVFDVAIKLYNGNTGTSTVN